MPADCRSPGHKRLEHRLPTLGDLVPAECRAAPPATGQVFLGRREVAPAVASHRVVPAHGRLRPRQTQPWLTDTKSSWSKSRVLWTCSHLLQLRGVCQNRATFPTDARRGDCSFVPERSVDVSIALQRARHNPSTIGSFAGFVGQFSPLLSNHEYSLAVLYRDSMESRMTWPLYATKTAAACQSRRGASHSGRSPRQTDAQTRPAASRPIAGAARGCSPAGEATFTLPVTGRHFRAASVATITASARVPREQPRRARR